jgi:transcriptional regulator with XRE-family HTH domain
MDAAAVGRMVRWARKRAGMTQVQLAAACDVPQSTIARIERGTVAPRAGTLLQLLAATGHELSVDRAIGTDADREAIRDRLVVPVALRARRSIGGRPGARRPAATRVLGRLRQSGVRFVLIGELAESAHGAPLSSVRHAEVVCAPDPENRRRLAGALEADARHLRLTDEPIPGDTFEVLERNARRMLVDVALLVKVASLEDLIRIRRARGGPEDHRALELLGALRDELDRGERATSPGGGRRFPRS